MKKTLAPGSRGPHISWWKKAGQACWYSFWTLGLSSILILAAGFGIFFIMVHIPYPLSSRPVVKNSEDIIIVLTGEKGRRARGWQLFSQGLAPRLHISGLSHDLTPRPGLSWDYARNTQQNMAFTAKIFQHKGIHTVRLVTSDYHMPRCLLLAGHWWPADIKITQDKVHRRVHWKRRLYLLISEYLKIIVILLSRLYWGCWVWAGCH